MTTRADDIRDALEAIRKKNKGKLTRAAVVKAARDRRNILHREFDWNDKTAAYQHRLERAQELITRYVTVTIIHKARKITAPYYVHDPEAPPNEPGYIPLSTPEGMQRKHATTIVLVELDRCESAIERARNIAGVLDKQHPGLADMLQDMLEEIVSIRVKLAAE